MNPSHSNKRQIGLFTRSFPKNAHKDAKHCSFCKKYGGACVTHNISNCYKLRRMVSVRKDLGRASLVAWPPIRRPLVLSCNFQQRSQNLRRQTNSLRRALRSANAGMTVRLVTLTPLNGVGLVAHWEATEERLN